MFCIFDRLPDARPGRIVSCRKVLLAALFATVTAASSGLVIAAPSPIDGNFSLSNTDGREVNDRTYRGKWELIYFGFATCPEVCTTVMQRVAVALQELGATAGKLQPLFITLDPVHDTPGRLASYLNTFDRRLIGLIGTEKQTQEAVRSFRMYVKRRALESGTSTIEHSSFLFLMKPDGTFARLLSGDTSGHHLAEELRGLLQ